MLSSYKSYIQPVITYLLLIVTTYYIYVLYKDNRAIKQINTQNVAALNNMQVLNKQWATKYAAVVDLNNNKDKLLADKDETILTQMSVIINLKKVQNQGFGIVIEDPKDSSNKELVFSDSSSFYKYIINVWPNQLPLPYYNFNMSFTPIYPSVYLTRSNDGLWSGYIKVQKELSDYITFGDLKVYVDRDEFSRVEEKKLRIDIGVGLKTIITPEAYLGIKGAILINTKHQMDFTYVINKSWSIIGYNYYFNVKK